MDLISLAVSIGVLGGVATFVLLALGMGVQIWVAFIAWATFYHCGGKEEGLKALTNNIFGIMALIALLLAHPAPALEARSAFRCGPGFVSWLRFSFLVYAAKAPGAERRSLWRLRYAAVAGLALDRQQARRGHFRFAREPVRGWRDLADHRRAARIHFAEGRAGAGRGGYANGTTPPAEPPA